MSERARATAEVVSFAGPYEYDGALVSIQDFSERYQLAIASGAIYTPGRGLREILAGYGIMGCYSGFAYSDEVRSAKLHPCIFEEVAHLLGTRFAEMLNVGDRDPKDIVGAAFLILSRSEPTDGSARSGPRQPIFRIIYSAASPGPGQ